MNLRAKIYFLPFAHLRLSFFMHINEIKATLLKILTVCERLLTLLFLIFLIYGFDEPYTAGLTLIAALIHEGGHEAFLFISGGHGGRIRARLSGFGIKGPSAQSYGKEIMLYLCGPAANFVLAAIFLFLVPALGDYARAGAFINLATGVSNLLPLPGYDGYGIIRTLLDAYAMPSVCYKLLSAAALTVSALVSWFSLYLLSRVGDGYWIYALFISGTLSVISGSLKKMKFEDY